MSLLRHITEKWHSDPTVPHLLDGTSPSPNNDVPLPDGEHLSPTQYMPSSTASLPVPLPSHSTRARRPLDTSSLPASPQEGRSRSNSAASSPSGEKWYHWRSPKSKQGVSQEQEHRTRQLVATAVRSVLGTASPIAHDILRFSSEVLQFAPVPGLDAAAKTLLAIWDSVDKIKENRSACLRLTERCATILISVRQDVSRVGDQVSAELRLPQAQFEIALGQVAEFMSQQAERHFFSQYIHRDSILEEISKCDEKLNDALGRFNREIVLRVFETVLAINAKTPTIPAAPPPAYLLEQSPSAEPDTVRRSPLKDGQADDTKIIREKLLVIQERQNQQDKEQDMAELRKAEADISAQMDNNQDEQVLPRLGFTEDDQAEGLKTIRRIMEAESHYPFMRTSPAKGTEQSPLNRAHTWPLNGGTKSQDDITSREFIASGLEYLRRLGPDFQLKIPDWTIARFEILRGRCVSQSASAHVYRGKWRKQTVAIKVLATDTLYHTFIAEVLTWKQLKHRNVLELYGASSGKGRPPCPLMKYGNLTQYLKHLEWESEGGLEIWDLDRLGIIDDIAKGMEYLHSMDILHGDLRARNVLVDTGRCVVSDFGQSRKISAMWRLENRPLRSRLRWQAPEQMRKEPHLASSIDVYSYAMCIIEVLTMGAVPWPNLLNDDIQRLVLDNHERPPFPDRLAQSLSIIDLLHDCWDDDPARRPPFSLICQLLSRMRESRKPFDDKVGLNTDVFFNPVEVASNSTGTTTVPGASLLFQFDNDTPAPLEQSVPASKSDTSSLFAPNDDAAETSIDLSYDSGYGSPMPGDATASELRNARRYSIALSHEFDPTLSLALWTPGHVALGDVGYVDARNGSFVFLYNAARAVPHSSIPVWHAYGKITVTTQHLNLAHADSQESGFSDDGPSSSPNIHRRYTFPLWASRKLAYLCTDQTVYHYLESSTLEAPKRWFEANADTILETYVQSHQRVTKEDLILVVGTLSAKHYALFVSHHSPDGQLYFDVSPSHEIGQPWGSFSTTAFKPSFGRLNKLFQPTRPPAQFATKVSTQDAEDILLIARLQIGTDSGEATLR